MRQKSRQGTSAANHDSLGIGIDGVTIVKCSGLIGSKVIEEVLHDILEVAGVVLKSSVDCRSTGAACLRYLGTYFSCKAYLVCNRVELALFF